MNQEAFTLMAVILAFVIYITARGELKKYIGFLTG
jgi:hypothetical protein